MASRDSKKLALLGPMHPYRGGIAHFLEKLYNGFRARGWDVDAATFTRQYPELLFPGKTQLVEGNVPDAVPAVRLLDTLNPLTWARTARHLHRGRPDALLFKYWMPFFAPAFGWIARRVRRDGARVLAIVDNAKPHEARPGDHALTRYALRACDHLLVMSDSVERDLHDLGIDVPITRVPHPVYDNFGETQDKAAARAHLDLPADAPVLLFFGFVRRYKGLHVLLDAMPHVLEALPDAHLVIAGEFYDDEGPYHAQVEQAGLEGRVLFASDYVPDDAVAAYFSAADVVVQPYVTATQSGVAQIAFHFERPLIVTDVGGLPETVPHERAGFVVPPEDPPALADAVVRFFRDDWAERLTEGVRQEKKKYAWEVLYDAVERLIQSDPT